MEVVVLSAEHPKKGKEEYEGVRLIALLMQAGVNPGAKSLHPYRTRWVCHRYRADGCAGLQRLPAGFHRNGRKVQTGDARHGKFSLGQGYRQDRGQVTVQTMKTLRPGNHRPGNFAGLHRMPQPDSIHRANPYPNSGQHGLVYPRATAIPTTGARCTAPAEKTILRVFLRG